MELSPESDMKHRPFYKYHQAARKGNLSGVRDELDKGVDVNIRNITGEVALHECCSYGETRIAEYILERGGDPNIQDNRGVSPLFPACLYRHFDTCEALLRHGADINLRDLLEGFTVLHTATKLGMHDVVEFLLENGADRKVPSNELRTPLHLAAIEGHKYIVEMLSEGLVGIRQLDADSKSPLELASEHGHKKCAKHLKALLLHSLDENPFDLIQAAMNNNVDAILSLLKQGERPDEEDAETGDTAMHVAACFGSLDAMALLHETGADIAKVNNAGLTPLHIAAKSGQPQACNVLIKWSGGVEKLNPEIDGSHQESPLHLASRSGHEDVVAELLRLGISVKSRNGEGRTPLFYAIEDGHTEIVRMLIKGGSVVSEKDEFAMSPLHVAVEAQEFEIATILIEHGAEAHVIDKEGDTPLHLACSAGDVRMVKLLIDKGAPVTGLNNASRLAYDLAVENENHEVTEYLDLLSSSKYDQDD